MARGSIYHFLRRAFCQCVSISQIVHFDVSDIVTVLDIHVAVDGAHSAGLLRRARGWRRGRRRFGAQGRSDRRDIDVLNAFL